MSDGDNRGRGGSLGLSCLQAPKMWLAIESMIVVEQHIIIIRGVGILVWTSHLAVTLGKLAADNY